MSKTIIAMQCIAASVCRISHFTCLPPTQIAIPDVLHHVLVLVHVGGSAIDFSNTTILTAVLHRVGCGDPVLDITSL